VFDDLVFESLNGFSESWAFMTTLFKRLNSKPSNVTIFKGSCHHLQVMDKIIGLVREHRESL
jgi:hypothetical protein